ncbi:MAG: hypothetical protein ACOX1J_06470 [Dethiobacteria bacterium]
MEKLGVPSVLLVARGFEHDVESGSYDNGMTMLRRVILKGYYWYIPSEESRPIAESHFNDIIDALVRPLTPDEEDPPQLEKVDLPPITITSCCYEHAIQEFQEIFDKNHWGDGLALIPPTREAVDLMLTGTTRPPDEVIGKVPIKNGEATVEKIAINAVMAGAKPEYLPVIIAAMEAVSGWGTLEDYDLIHPQGSLGGFQLAIWVSGPMGEKLNMNSKDRIWTYGNRANSTIGRAIRLCLINFGHMWPGINDMARSRVYPFTFFTFAEDFSSSPWEPYHVTYGFDAEESCITVSTISGNMPVNYTVIFQIKPGFKFQIIRNRFSGFYGTFCTLFKEKITDFAHNHFIPVCILRSKKIAVDMTQLWILMDNSSSYPQTPQLLGQHCALPTYPQQLPLPQLFF